MIPPLAIIQARIGSTRLPRKLLLPIDGEPLLRRVYRLTVEAFGAEHTIIALPATAENDELAALIPGAQVFRWDGPENDVLGRFHACAHRYRWHPDSVLVRVTPDDPLKDPAAMRRVAAGERLPVEIGGEAFTLAMLDRAEVSSGEREHLTYTLFPTLPPPPPPGVWTIDTQADYDAVVSARRA